MAAKHQSGESSNPAGSFGEGYPALLTVDQAAELAQIPKRTIYEWSSRGLLRGCSCRAGRYLRIFRDGFLTKFLDGGFSCAKTGS